MKMLKERFLRAFLYKWRKLGTEISPSTAYEYCWGSCFHVGRPIPRDVPKGHMVVYVGEDYKRFVIRVSFLEHPLFKVLLDRARDVYDFTPDSRLCIPCDESIFLNIVRHVDNQQNRMIWLCC
ncbi:SAUR-like auxin-responsive protein family [Tasmannia lanceolata]|uniref:SAUR-like auxin-responsive protein family n=1 Tax=Tasmannia lanceolata TaxID=3420 RepID=UPI004062EB55